MRQAQADRLLRTILDDIEIDYLPFPDLGCYATIDRFGHQVLLVAREGPVLAPDVPEPMALIQVSTVLLADVETDHPSHWRTLALMNGRIPFGKLFLNEGGQITVAVELYAEMTGPRDVGAALLTVTMLADNLGDQLAEHFEGRRVFWKHGRKSPAA